MSDAPDDGRTRLCADVLAEAAAIAGALGELPHEAPLDPAARARLSAAAAAAGRVSARAGGLGGEPVARLADALARVIAGLLEGRVRFEALPYLGSAAEILRQATARLADGGALDPVPVEAARFELESVLPAPAATRPVSPDVPVTRLTRG